MSILYNQQKKENLKTLVDELSSIKGIDKTSIIATIEDVVAELSAKKYGPCNLVAIIDRSTYEIVVSRILDVVDEIEDFYTQIDLQQAREKNEDKSIQLGQTVSEQLDMFDFTRMMAKNALDLLVKKISAIERKKEYDIYKEEIGNIVLGKIKKITTRNIYVDINGHEALLPQEATIPYEKFRLREKVYFYIDNVKEADRGPQIILSRSHKNLVAMLVEKEVPEITDGIVFIHSVSRDPGSKSKIAVYSINPNVDPVKSCVGIMGTRIKAVSNAIGQEKIDVIKYSANVAEFIVNAMSPCEVLRVTVHDAARRAIVVVPDDNLSIAIGRNGQNVKLASSLTKHNISIIKESDDKTKRMEEQNVKIEMLCLALNCDEMLAHAFFSAGLTSVRDIANIPQDDLVSFVSLDKIHAKIFIERAKRYISTKITELVDGALEKSYDERLANLDWPDPIMAHTVIEKGITKVKEVKQLSHEQLCAILDKYCLDYEDSDIILNSAIRIISGG